MSRPIPATDDTHGPFRKVVRVDIEPLMGYSHTARQAVEVPGRTARAEILDCGHRGNTLTRDYQQPAKRRRCYACREDPPPTRTRVRNPRTRQGDPARAHLSVVE